MSKQNMGTFIDMVKTLRQECGAGIQDCRLALEESGRDYDRALLVLREKMAREAEKLDGRQACEGWLETYSHGNGRLAVVVEINTETDFTARSPQVRALGREIALQIAAASPTYVCEGDIPEGTIRELSERTRVEAEAAGKPDKVMKAMLAGRLGKFAAQNALLSQPYIRDERITVSELIGRFSARIGESIQVRRFIRWEMQEAENG